MKGDFSRMIFDRKKHYSSVLMQQGRVQLDSDWNEQQAQNQYRVKTEATDVIGSCGAPADDPGFEITAVDPGRLIIGQGRYYVNGILCENEADVAYDSQPDLDSPPDVLKLLDKGKTSDAIVYLDVWERHITAVDDPRIREVALDGPDTTTRIKTIWQVKVLPIHIQEPDPKKFTEFLKERDEVHAQIKKVKLSGGTLEEIRRLGGLLKKAEREIAMRPGEITCGTPLEEWDELVKPRTGTLNARTLKGGDDYKTNPCLLPPTAGYQRLENQLYRVEIHRGGALGTDKVTFTWSRDNGSVVAPIEKISGKEVTVRDVGPDSVLGFANGQWVEVLDDRWELGQKPGQLVQIVDVDPARRILTMATAPTPLATNADGVDKTQHPRLRRWDCKDAAGAEAEVPATTSWTELEGGIQVVFSAGTYATGDYWLIPGRTATGEIEWPPYEIPNTNPIPQPPLGIDHHTCRLALVHFETEKKSWTVHDCRKIFYPLTGFPPALHIAGTNWLNDDVLPLDEFMKNGLEIRVDTPYKLISVGDPTVIVTAQVPFAGAGETTPDVLFVLDGEIEVGVRFIRWIPVKALAEQLNQVLKNQPLVLLRVTLKGHTLWSDVGDEQLYLDGQAFGEPGLRADKKTARTALIFPSGNGAKASDFESWFYVGPSKPETVPLVVKTVRFLSVEGMVSSAGVITLPLASESNILFKAGEKISTIEIAFSRPVRPQGLGPLNEPQSIRLDILSGSKRRKIPGNISVQDEVARFVIYKPSTFAEGSYRMTILGNAAGDRPAVKAKEDGAALDGDFNGQPGGDFILPFKAV
jgi:hypothetical protein